MNPALEAALTTLSFSGAMVLLAVARFVYNRGTTRHVLTIGKTNDPSYFHCKTTSHEDMIRSINGSRRLRKIEPTTEQ